MGKYEHKDTTPYVPILTEIEKILGIEAKSDQITDRETGKTAKGYGFTREEAKHDAYERLQSDSGGSSGSSSGGGGSCCYITTACLDAMGLPRDSLEMRAMKTLTKDHILKSFRGKKDYVLYGRKAPTIVQAIESRDNSQDIWKRVYETLRNITSTIFSRDYGKAHQQYKELVLGLESEFVKSR